VVTGKGERIVFDKSKKLKKDRMRGTQLRWLQAALQCGCGIEEFVVVGWDTWHGHTGENLSNKF